METNCDDRVRERQGLRGGEKMPVLTFAKSGAMIPLALPQLSLTVGTVVIVFVFCSTKTQSALH